MLDANALNQLVQDEIRKNVSTQVNTALSDPKWIEDLETNIVSHVQDRITARFANIETIPDLIATVESSVEKMFRSGMIPSIDHLVDNILLAQVVDQAVENLVSTTIENLLLDEAWLTKIQNQIGREFSDRVARTIKDTGVKDVLRELVNESKEDIGSEVFENINRELYIEHGVVVAKNHFNADTASIEKDATVKGSLSVSGDLAILGSINTNNRSFRELADVIESNALSKLKEHFLEEASDTVVNRMQKGIDIKNINVRGKPLIEDGILGEGIIGSHIQSVGTLKSLKVSTVFSANNKRIGVNTDSPTSALTVWDDEVSLDIGKHSLNTAQIGTTKAQGLNVITNNQTHLSVDKDGLVWVKELQVGRNKIATALQTPGHSGTKGDIVFNINYKSGEPFAWICLGAFRWAELKSA